MTVRHIDRTRQLMDKIDREVPRRLFRQGGLLRTTARRSIKVRKKGKSSPGSQPYSRFAGNYGLRDIRFALVPGQDRVIVGPVYRLGGDAVSPAPHVHEFAGRTRLKNGKIAAFPKRPVMGPALQKLVNDPRYLGAFKNMI